MAASDKSGERNSGERKFLHDISNPLTTALFLLDTMIDSNGENPAPGMERLVKVRMALRRSQEMVHARREELQASSVA